MLPTSSIFTTAWNLDRKNLFNWKDEEPGNFERKVKRFFSRERFLKLRGDWIIFFKKDDELRKIVLRQHQTRAVEKVVERALNPVKHTGLVWHTQGSGKTFTMIAAAEQILAHSAFEKPTVIMLVDRNELESQLFGNLKAYGLGYEQATSKARLRELLRADYRGLIVSMIHKFDRADANLCSRANVFVLVDKAHRTTSGDLGNYLVAALPNATMIGALLVRLLTRSPTAKAPSRSLVRMMKRVTSTSTRLPSPSRTVPRCRFTTPWRQTTSACRVSNWKRSFSTWWKLRASVTSKS